MKRKLLLTFLFCTALTSYSHLFAPISAYPKEMENSKYFHQIKLGCANNNQNIPTYFSTQTGQRYLEDEICIENGEYIDIVFEGIPPYQYKFSSPHFHHIPQASITQFQEITSFQCWLNDTAIAFDSLKECVNINQMQIPCLFYFSISTETHGYLLVTEVNEDFIVANIKVSPHLGLAQK